MKFRSIKYPNIEFSLKNSKLFWSLNMDANLTRRYIAFKVLRPEEFRSKKFGDFSKETSLRILPLIPLSLRAHICFQLLVSSAFIKPNTLSF